MFWDVFGSDIHLFTFHLFLALLAVTGLNYVLSFIAVVLFFVFYTKPDGCFINKFFISFNMLFCMVASIVSVLPKVQVQDTQSNMQLFNTNVEKCELIYSEHYLVFCPRTLSHGQVFSSPPSSPCTPCFWPGLPWPLSLVRMLPNIMLSSQRCHVCQDNSNPWSLHRSNAKDV